MQLAVIVIAAKLFGRLCEKYLKQPSVIGEVLAGMVIGPFALGGVSLPGLGPLFSVAEGGHVEERMHTIAVVASVVLLFLAGLESDLKKFLRYVAAGVATGLGGAILSFFLGAGVTVWLGGASGLADPKALIMGTVATATSVGLTARVLADRHRMDSPEGAAIVSAAVVDDVIGLLVLAVVVSMAADQGEGGGHVPWMHIGGIAVKALTVWIVLLALGAVFARQIAGFLKLFGGTEASTAAALGLALLVAGIAESAGMALIIGAYVMGLSLSKTDLRHELEHGISAIYHLFVPIFFCITGMMVDLSRISSVLLFGLVFTLVAVIGKVVGCGLPALPLGFNLRGAMRIGVGMAPRMEVALIVAGIAVRRNVVGADMMGVVILMVLITAVGAPPVLWRLFDNRSGRRSERDEEVEEMIDFPIRFPGPHVARLALSRMVEAFQKEQFYSYRLPIGIDLFELRKEHMIVYAKVEKDDLVLSARPSSMQYVRFIALEELLDLEQIFSDASRLSNMDSLKRSLLGLGGEQKGTP